MNPRSQTATFLSDQDQRSEQFLARMRPALAQRDAEALADVALEHYDCSALRDLAATGTTDARRVACLALGLTGCLDCVICLSDCLHDDDSVVSDLAEQALWSVWFRAGSCVAMPAFHAGVTAMDADDYEQAITSFTESLHLDPDFVEARNQRALARYLQDDWWGALADCQQVVREQPLHFGAWAGTGHSHAHLGRLKHAAAAYRQALDIHPRMHAVRGALKRIEAKLEELDGA